tara:strand:+ start:5469 stop:5786 length:318 start_codon:yes stop_codon:yes gene_type:complete
MYYNEEKRAMARMTKAMKKREESNLRDSFGKKTKWQIGDEIKANRYMAGEFDGVMRLRVVGFDKQHNWYVVRYVTARCVGESLLREDYFPVLQRHLEDEGQRIEL